VVGYGRRRRACRHAANRYFKTYGVTKEVLAKVAV